MVSQTLESRQYRHGHVKRRKHRVSPVITLGVCMKATLRLWAQEEGIQLEPRSPSELRRLRSELIFFQHYLGIIDK